MKWLLFAVALITLGLASGRPSSKILQQLVDFEKKLLQSKGIQARGKSNGNNGIDAEGLGPLEREGATCVETKTGEHCNRPHRPPNPDETQTEIHVQDMARELLSRGIDNQELINTMARAIARTGKPLYEVVELIPNGKRMLESYLNKHKEKRSSFLLSNYWQDGIIPYKMDQLPSSHQPTVQDAINFYEANTCIRFVPFDSHSQYGLTHDTYLDFIPDSGCYSYIGRVFSGAQVISPCGDSLVGVAMHEILHALGSHHEQSRGDRDENLLVLFDNLREGVEGNFESVTTFDTSVPYDYGSVMHYSLGSFSAYGENTLSIFDRNLEFLVGQRNVLSFYDQQAVNAQYQCKERNCPGFSTECQNGGYVGYVSDACKCVCPYGLGGADCSQVASTSCGGIIELSGNNEETITSPDHPQTYDNNMECVWYVKSPSNTHVRLDFLELDLESSGSYCYDYLEVKHHLLGQPGERICGDYFTQSRITSFNTLMLILKTDDTQVRTGFKVTVGVATVDEVGHNSIDRGRSYRGSMAITQGYVPCLSWTDANNECPISTLTHGDADGIGDHNYCRNPNGAEMPWCYTNLYSCETDFCDINLINTCHDKRADCTTLLGLDNIYCSTEEGFTNCRLTCDFCNRISLTDSATIAPATPAPATPAPTTPAPATPAPATPAPTTPSPPGPSAATPAPTEAPTPAPTEAPTPATTEPPGPLECLTEPSGVNYQGTEQYAENGKRCKKWSQMKDYLEGLVFPDESVKAAGRYCRNPDGDTRPWCYTNKKKGTWAYCDIPLCESEESSEESEESSEEESPKECMEEVDGSDYMGTVAVNNYGFDCLPWTYFSYPASQFPDETVADAANYCRNPDGDAGPWCFYEYFGTIYYAFCDIPYCDKRKRKFSEPQVVKTLASKNTELRKKGNINTAKVQQLHELENMLDKLIAEVE